MPLASLMISFTNDHMGWYWQPNRMLFNRDDILHLWTVDHMGSGHTRLPERKRMWGESWKRGVVGKKAVAVTDPLRSPSLLTNCRLINSRLTNSLLPNCRLINILLTNSLLPNILLTNNMSTSSVFSISDAPCYSSVVITVFMIGILDSFFFTVMLSVTNQGEISSRLVLACKVICIRYWYTDMFLQALQYCYFDKLNAQVTKSESTWPNFQKASHRAQIRQQSGNQSFWGVKAWTAQTISAWLFTKEI